MRRWVGRSLLVIAGIHLVLGVAVFGDVVPPVIRAGVFDTVTLAAPPRRAAAFWFLIVGLLTLLLGGLADDNERRGARLPAFLGWGLLGIAVVGCVLMPLSGFWLLFVPAVGALLQRRRETGEG